MLTATVETRRAQLTACQSDRGADLCRWIVAGKLHNQEKLLRYFAKSRDGEKRSALESNAVALRRLRRSALATEGVTPDEVRPRSWVWKGRVDDLLEAGRKHAPRRPRLCSRSHQGALMPSMRAQLRLWHSDLTRMGAVMNAGLEPFAGFLHVERSGKPSLVLDLMEEFRQPVVDRPILSWLNKGAN